jgi:hypothetical protein
MCVCAHRKLENFNQIFLAKSLKTKLFYKKRIFLVVRLVGKIEDYSSNILRYTTHKTFHFLSFLYRCTHTQIFELWLQI